jgi:DNA-binding NtrC family response regulator
MREGVQAPASSRLAGTKVLVAEASAIIALEMELILQEQGCVVLGPTATMADTLASLRHDRPDVALLDLHLRDGPATPIVATLTSAGVPFALVTADKRNALAEVSLAGVPRIEKPWSAGAIVQMVGRLLASPAVQLSGKPPAAAAASS